VDAVCLRQRAQDNVMSLLRSRGFEKVEIRCSGRHRGCCMYMQTSV